jgi:hypothetical protein
MPGVSGIGMAPNRSEESLVRVGSLHGIHGRLQSSCIHKGSASGRSQAIKQLNSLYFIPVRAGPEICHGGAQVRRGPVVN